MAVLRRLREVSLHLLSKNFHACIDDLTFESSDLPHGQLSIKGNDSHNKKWQEIKETIKDRQ